MKTDYFYMGMTRTSIFGSWSLRSSFHTVCPEDGTFVVYTVPDAAGVLGSQCAGLGVEGGWQLRLGLGRLDFSHRKTLQSDFGTCSSWADS